jgi:hypothetical protein
MFAPANVLSAEQRRLIQLYAGLAEADRQSLLAFAEFLAQRGTGAAADEAPASSPQDPLAIPRPQEESVVGAIKRLSKSYFMLDRSTLLNETSSLMTAHVIHGRPAAQVIDDLEALFERRYRDHLAFWSQRGEPPSP